MKRYFCFILLSGIVFQLFGKVVNEELRERVYVQTDKQLYLAGEPVLMKLLTVDSGQKPLVFSKIAYAELVDDSIAKLQIKVELTGGSGSGRMILPVDLPTGYYRLIAYTQFMRNEGADVFFEKNIAVVNTFQSAYQRMETEAENHFPPDIARSYREEGMRDVSIQPDRSTYTTRVQGELILNGLPEDIHTLSVSIAGKDFVPVADSDPSLFLKNRMLKSDDNENTDSGMAFLPEYEGHVITGKIVENPALSEPASFIPRNSNYNSIMVPGLSFPSVEGIRFFTGQKSGTDDVRFFTSGISGTKEIATVIYHAGERYRVDVHSPFVTRHVPKQVSALRIDSVYYDRLLERSVALQVFRYISEEPSANQLISDPYISMKPTFSYMLDEYTRFTTMQEVFTEFITGARFRRNAGKQEISVLTKKDNYFDYGTMPLVLLDGVPVSEHNVIYNYDPLLVEQINIYSGPYIYGGNSFDGIVELITYNRLYTDLHLDRSSQVFSYEGPQLPYRLDTPNYSEDKNRQSRMPDSRHTLLWNPDVQTDGKNSIRLLFDTSDLTGEFQATVEGVTKDGTFIFATTFFTVN